MNKKQLTKAFHFSEEDLNANREGHLSVAQRAILQNRLDTALATVVIVIVLAIACASGVSEVHALAAVFLFLIVLMIQRIAKAIMLQRALRTERITTYFGRIHLEVNRNRRAQLFIADANGVRYFQITINQLLALRDGEYYRVYVSPHSDMILSIEPVNLNRTEDDAEAYAVDLSALAQDDAESESEKPKRGTVVLGDDGELSFNHDSST